MRNKTLPALLLAGMMLLTACGGTVSSDSTAQQSAAGTDNTSTAAAAATGDVTELTVWAKDRHDQEYMQGVIDQFMAENPDIVINYEMYTDNYDQTVEIATGSGELPDLLAVNGKQSVVNNLMARNLLTFLEDYASDEFKARFDDSLFVEGVNLQDGHVISYPFTGTSLRLVYNKDIFAQVGIENPPATLEEFVSAAKLITQELGSEGVYGFALPLKNPTSGLGRGFMSIPQLEGNPVRDGFDFQTGEYDFNYYRDVLEAFTEIWQSDAAFPGCESLDIDPLRTQFADGKIGMYMTYNHSEWGVYTDQFPTEVDWGYAMLPTSSGTITGSQSMNAGIYYVIPTTCENPEAAWRFMEYLYSEDNMIGYYEGGYGVPVLESVVEAANEPESIAYLPYMALQPTDKIWLSGPSYAQVEGDDYGKVFVSIIFGETNDVDAAIEDLNTRYNAAYEKSMAAGTDEEILYPDFDAANPAG